MASNQKEQQKTNFA